MLSRLSWLSVVCGLNAALLSVSLGQVFDNPQAAQADPDFAIQGEYASASKGVQLIAMGDGEFEMVVYEGGLPGAGWNGAAPSRLDLDADTFEPLIDSMQLKRVERVSPTMGAKPPADAIVLFDGSEQSLQEHWQPGAQRTADGLLKMGVTTKQSFQDYQLHVEFRLPFMPAARGQGRGNSGVYHQGRYETQVLDSFGLAGKNNELGGLYSKRDPDLNMCLPPLVWQTYDVDFTAARYDAEQKKIANARITVKLNGVIVQNNVEVDGSTVAAPLGESPEPGPIHLQDHGNPVYYRNIWLVPRDLSKEARRPVVAGFERLFADSDPDHLGGRLLIDALGCQTCHRAETPAAAPGPVLDQVSSRVRLDHLVEFIANPRATKVGTTMPDPWHGSSDEQRRTNALMIAAYLYKDQPVVLDQTSDLQSAKRGEQIYHEQGCAVCHGPRQSDAKMPLASGADAGGQWVPLGALAAKYTLGSLSDFLLNPEAVRPCGRMPKTVANRLDARDVASFLLQEVVISSQEPAIRRMVHQGNWSQLPSSKQLPEGKASLERELRIDDVPGTFAATFDSYLQIVEPGKYRFKISCDDGGRISIGNQVVVNHDGVHPESERSGEIQLEAGVHPIRIEYFEGGGQRALKAFVESDRLESTPLVTFLIATPDAVTKPLVPTLTKLEASFAEQGAKLFVSAGCVQCHSAKAPKDDGSIAKAKPLDQLRLDQGCLSANVPAGLPQYDLTSRQRGRIADAIKSLGPQLLAHAAIGSDTQQLHYLMSSLNCYACHARNQIGGPTATTNTLFVTTKPEMGDEGRVPPVLDGVGDKLREDYLATLLSQGAKDRPYMKTRMPGFGSRAAEQLLPLLVKLDQKTTGADGSRVTVSRSDLLGDGRILCGNDGLACIKCHTFGGVGLAGIQAIDMLQMPKRLRRDWFERYLLAPQVYRPGTRMPASFNDGVSVFTKIAGGQPEHQIEAMWQYLLLDGEAKAPSGLLPNAIELKSTDRPVLYRNFFNGVSPRTIAVGYPEGVNLFWDAESMLLGAVWKNSFIDAAKHWTGRGEGNQNPLGDGVVKLDAASPVLSGGWDEATPWPNQPKESQAYRFLGYRLDAQGRPTFRYRVAELVVEDKPLAVVNAEGNRMFSRTFLIQGNQAASLLLAKGKFVQEPNGEIRVDDRYWIKVAEGEAKPLPFGDQSELRAVVQPTSDKPAQVTVIIRW